MAGSNPDPHTGDNIEEHLGLRTLRRYTEGTLAHDDRRTPVRLVIDRTTGRLVFPIEAGALDAGQLVLMLPDETRCVLQLLLVIERLERSESHEAPDRWRAYHAAFAGLTTGSGSGASGSGGSGSVGSSIPGTGGMSGGGSGVRGVWAIASIEAGKTETLLFNPEELMVPNALRSVEASLVRTLNANRAGLTRACSRHLGVQVPDPVAVGVDPLGVDVRARFGVLRLEFARHSPDAPSVSASLDAILN